MNVSELGPAKYASRVFLGSSEPEYNLYNADRVYCGFWSCYHDGPLPSDLEILPAETIVH